MDTTDNICAPATGVGGAISIIRLAGPQVLDIANRIWRGKKPLSAELKRQMILGDLAGDEVLAVYFAAPHSYTGDEVVEFHCHGGVKAARAALKAAQEAGCRLAEPGEFTFRRFVNGKIDLVQAEAMGDIINAASDGALRLAERQLNGALSRKFADLRGKIVHCLGECESHLDFPEEDLDFDPELPQKITEIAEFITQLIAGMQSGNLLRDGVRVAIAGKPNAGKSSLLNAILGYDRAIVSAIPGTTRDTVEASTTFGDIPVHLVDTAGLREADGEIEKLGIDRSRASIRQAQVVFWVLDATETAVEPLTGTGTTPVIAVWNKCDLVPDFQIPKSPLASVAISAKTGAGLAQLKAVFDQIIGHATAAENIECAINARHQELLMEAMSDLPEATTEALAGNYELAAVNLRRALHLTGMVTGETTDPDILDDIFSRFCIGK